jgi:NMD protein affecting ribosome stability and mRNA decay
MTLITRSSTLSAPQHSDKQALYLQISSKAVLTDSDRMAAMESRRDQLLQDKSHDPTKPTRKLVEPTICESCGATFRAGRWTWEPGPAEAARSTCSACQRIRDDYPAGFVTVRGSFTKAHRDEILAVIRHTENREKQDHPINRIIRIDDDEEGLVVRTTEPHLTQAIGKALRGAFKGTLKLSYEEDIVRVLWTRES